MCDEKNEPVVLNNYPNLEKEIECRNCGRPHPFRVPEVRIDLHDGRTGELVTRSPREEVTDGFTVWMNGRWIIDASTLPYKGIIYVSKNRFEIIDEDSSTIVLRFIGDDLDIKKMLK